MFASNTTQVSEDVNYIESVFQSWLYTGNGSTQTITNGIDLAGKGGLVWLKARNQAYDHTLIDTVRGSNKVLYSNATVAEATNANVISAFNNNGFTTPGTSTYSGQNGTTYASWTFRKQPKFFDVVTYTGNGSARTIAHSLGSVPGCIIVKCTSAASSWYAQHRSLATTSNQYVNLNSTAAAQSPSDTWNSTLPTSTNFSLGTDANVNDIGKTYVAYIFAHNAGGFGLTGTDNVISCGSFTTDASGNATVNLGYELQWVVTKKSSSTGSWNVQDVMRGLPVSGTKANLEANTSAAEGSFSPVEINATGYAFTGGAASSTYIYIAIRRGPMKTPTSGTSVFSPQLEGGTAGTDITTNFPIDWQLIKGRASAQTTYGITRLTGVSTNTTEAAGYLLQTASTAAELADSTSTRYWSNTGFQVPSGFGGGSSTAYITENFRRAPGFFDVVCYTGTGVARTVNHNLGVAPELMIVKSRTSSTASWAVYSAALGAGQVLNLELTSGAAANNASWNSTSPTASVFTVGNSPTTNSSGGTYVAYLFASCPGVSKVGSYTGNGSTQTIDCGFTGGARFVLIKRTDSTGDWYVYDTARGMTTLTDPYLLLNSTAAESATLGSVTSVTGGFALNASILAAINANGDSYIFLAIA